MNQDMLQDKRFDFTILENDIVRDTEKFSKNELLAYIAMCYHADKAGTCFPSYEGIARIMRASRTTAINAIQGLVEKGVIKLENRKTDVKKKELTSNLYTLAMGLMSGNMDVINALDVYAVMDTLSAALHNISSHWFSPVYISCDTSSTKSPR